MANLNQSLLMIVVKSSAVVSQSCTNTVYAMLSADEWEVGSEPPDINDGGFPTFYKTGWEYVPPI